MARREGPVDDRPVIGPRTRRVIEPLRSASTVRAGVFLVIGGVVAGAYLVLVAGFAQMFASPQTPRVATAVLAGVSAAIACTPPFLAPVRALEIAAVRTFLDLDLPTPDGATPPSSATRWRSAAWYGLHLVLGALVLLVVLLAVPVAIQLALSALGLEPILLTDWRPWDLVPAWAGVWALALVAVALLLVLPYVAAGARALLRQAAWPLLGPDQSERIAELEAAADRAAEQGRLARDLHDSVGHALTVTTLQAAAASRLLATDPDAARRALTAIEETGRTAMADLDHVLGLLRTGSAGPDRRPARTLADVDALLDDARLAGAVVRRTGPGAGQDLPRATSLEAYRVVQEALTNALRHAPGAPVDVEVGTAVDPRGALRVEIRNPVGSEAARPVGGGRGIAGMAERVRLLRGDFSAGPVVPVEVAGPGSEPDAGTWVVRATFPLGAASGTGGGGAGR
ncbi:histidine kinase [Cellulosimicrobium arenosum]|uniref:histidine kinase n=1 Tax=Cellulosimicrobium arenosum TaxID=2708133 RepID=A0A927G837_9MICO|nr:two-component sensor histidine kinase [Cellulosimicrobium arenosum]